MPLTAADREFCATLDRIDSMLCAERARWVPAGGVRPGERVPVALDVAVHHLVCRNYSNTMFTAYDLPRRMCAGEAQRAEQMRALCLAWSALPLSKIAGAELNALFRDRQFERACVHAQVRVCRLRHAGAAETAQAREDAVAGGTAPARRRLFAACVERAAAFCDRVLGPEAAVPRPSPFLPVAKLAPDWNMQWLLEDAGVNFYTNSRAYDAEREFQEAQREAQREFQEAPREAKRARVA